MIKPTLILLFSALSITIISRYLLSVEERYTSQLLNNPAQQHFSHQFKNFSLTNTNISGEAQSIIRSPATRMLTAENKTLMDDPEMLMYREQEPPIIITAQHAQVFHSDNLTDLQKNVKVTMPDKSNNNIVMTTEQLTLNNRTQSAKTDLPAKIVHGKGNMQGTGLEFDIHTKQIKFLNNVRGIYEQ